ncbi:hypothetical protein QBC46DRAFT_373282, partial [Diplogelasinospora grovesii]
MHCSSPNPSYLPSHVIAYVLYICSGLIITMPPMSDSCAFHIISLTLIIGPLRGKYLG